MTNPAIEDLMLFINEVIDIVSPEVVADRMMRDGEWIRINPWNIAEIIEKYLVADVLAEDFEQELELTYSEFYNILYEHVAPPRIVGSPPDLEKLLPGF